MTEDCEQTRVDFTEELELRRNMLHESIARLIGFSVASDRTRMIVVETGTIVAYAYLQSLPTDVRLYECIRIMNECSAGYMFLYDHKVSWKSCLNNVVLDARDKQLRIGALGEFDSYWNDSNQRMESVTTQLVAGRGRVAVLLYECLSLTGTHQMGFGVEYGHSNNASNNAHRNCIY
ncbi:hypothetical protein SISSUDRAFT_705663 [Sistotremastrum suecicum HHB10207 ss-3]|uniref:Protein kinase domain-containing protein n=1 Tax=Sistotremastrum suecicum HHB10207 ss-3 TaxID=1314776 RepID=A0A166DTP0_9AGAM|nr:hypothetical protein SISSUDRAFT_705663 [Sistotremastrum suecicum HHB10207 ss-3]